MAASSGPAGIGDQEKPTFEQIVLRVVVAVMLLVLFVLIVEFGQVRGRVGRLETEGGPAPAAATQAPLGSPQSFKVVLDEMAVAPNNVEVPAGTPLTLEVVNQGRIPHNLALDGGPTTPDLKPGQSATLEVGTVTRAMTGACSIPGPQGGGDDLEVRVSGAAPAAAAADEHADASLDDSAKLDPNATPPAAWRAYSPSLAPAPGGREHRVTLTATEGVLEVAPGVEQQAWSFDGKVPGPALRGKVGDLFTITLVNDPRNKLGHSIDFHASKVAWNDEMRTINPGERLVYQFKAKHAGIYLYHCGTAPTLHHIGNGMYGAIVVDPPDLAKIVGTVFDTTYKEGEYLLRPGFGRGGSQVLDLQPAQGGLVEFSLDERGLYPIVTHKFANVAKGALGLFQAGDVKATGGSH